jgi:hypothetical protein
MGNSLLSMLDDTGVVVLVVDFLMTITGAAGNLMGDECLNFLDAATAAAVEFKNYNEKMLLIAILLQRPVYCFWRADFHGQGATLVIPDNLMYSLPTISP